VSKIPGIALRFVPKLGL